MDCSMGQASLSITNSRSLLNWCPLSQWCHPVISSSVLSFFSCLQSFPESGSFLMRKLFASGGQSIRVSASASVLPVNIQDWFPLGCTGWISLQSKELSSLLQCHSSKAPILQHSAFFKVQISLMSTCTINVICVDGELEGWYVYINHYIEKFDDFPFSVGKKQCCRN